MSKTKIDEKVNLELEGIKRSKKSSIEIAAELNDALVEILSEEIRRKNKNISKKKLVENLRKILSD